eukprot:3283236-Prymnesium_polylepis.1
MAVFTVLIPRRSPLGRSHLCVVMCDLGSFPLILLFQEGLGCHERDLPTQSNHTHNPPTQKTFLNRHPRQMENDTNPRVDTLYMGTDGIIYRIAADCIVIDQQAPVELSYAAFLRMSHRDYQVGIDMLLSTNAIYGGVGYTSRNISVLHIPGVGMAWASRVGTTLPKHVAERQHNTDLRLGPDFLFLWPPGKALLAYLTVVEQTRIDNRTRFLSTCDPTPTSLFTDWNVVIPEVSTPVDPSTLT